MLTSLPLETIVQILEALGHHRDILSVSLACRTLNAVINNALSLQHLITYGACGVKAPYSTSISLRYSKDDIMEVKRRECAWMTFQFKEVLSEPMVPNSPCYSLWDGVLAQSKQCPENSSFSDGVRITHLKRSLHSLHSLSPGSTHLAETSIAQNQIQNLTISQPFIEYQLGFRFADLTIDPEQDLAVYGCVEEFENGEDGPSLRASVRLRKISESGAVHPSAVLEQINLGTVYSERLSFTIQVFGDFIGVLVNRGQDELRILNWKTGVLQMDHSFDFIFLSPYYFATCSRHSPVSLTIYCFQPRWTTLKFANTAPKPAVCVGVYHLPPLSLEIRFITKCVIRCEPAPVFEPPMYVMEEFLDENPFSTTKSMESDSGSMGSSDEGPTRITGSKPVHMPYYPAEPSPSPVPSPFIRPGENDFRVASISFIARHRQRRIEVMGFIAMSELCKHARVMQATAAVASFPDASPNPSSVLFRQPPTFHSEVEPSPFFVPWKDWDPQWIRFLEGELPRGWATYLHLNRVVLTTSTDPDGNKELADRRDWKPYLVVLDFNQQTFSPSYPARPGMAWNSTRSTPSLSPNVDSLSPALSTDPNTVVEQHERNSNPGYESKRETRVSEVLSRDPTRAALFVKKHGMGSQHLEETLEDQPTWLKMHLYNPLNHGWWLPAIDAERILLIFNSDDGREDDDDDSTRPKMRVLAF
ncbi:hypothetical protein DL93DRAFT_2234343 [Clavulina sp. PMI_390]|nr:hypothetical protein DL93DRAFT_2234343 [Clavulina sp. PMI_390]